jgi:hypothetical protein
VLPGDHWAYSLVFTARGKRPRLRALSNGLRELMIVAPGPDLSAVFQARNETQQAVWTTAAHVYLYASEMNRPRPRLHRGGAAESPGAGAGKPVTIVRASYDGNWNPEPLAWDVFAGATGDLDVSVRNHPLAGLATMESRPELVVVSGIEEHAFTPDEQAAVKSYVEAGGVILFETPGGRHDFAREAEAMAESLFGSTSQRLLDTRIVTGDGLDGAARLSRIGYRPYAQQVFAAPETTPRLRGLILDGQPRVLFSRQDISQALLDQPCWGVAGYSPEAARDLMGNILRHAAALRKP